MKRGKFGAGYEEGEMVWFAIDSENRTRAKVIKQSPMRTFTTIKYDSVQRSVLTQKISR